MRTPYLFPETKQPRKNPNKLMHVWDAGDAGSGFDVVFKCRRCNYESDWTPVKNTTEAKRGKPCPKCNEEST